MKYSVRLQDNQPVTFNGQKIGITICEDVWNDEDFWADRRYRRNPAVDLVNAGATLLFNLSASPWHLGKNRTRREMLSNLAAKTACPLVYCNLVGGNDELIFDGASLVYDAAGRLCGEGVVFGEDFLLIDTAKLGEIGPRDLEGEEKVYRALVLGLRDYLHKCGFKSAVLGLSGGIDSALTACIARDAVGAENVIGVGMPGPYSSSGSIDDARVLASNLGIRFELLCITDIFESYRKTLQKVFAGCKEDTTEENIQARTRGALLMTNDRGLGSGEGGRTRCRRPCGGQGVCA